jgi:hypothetical protein
MEVLIMAGTRSGFVKTTMAGGRIGSNEKNPMRYTPAHRAPDGRLVSSRLEMTVIVNEYGAKEPDAYKVIAWGGRADMFAKSLSKGKEMHFFLTSKSYFKKVYNNQNTIALNPDGTPITVRALSYTIRDFTYGADSNAQVNGEIAAGIRKVGWDDPKHPAHAEWLTKLSARKALFYQGGATFGYAVVKQPGEGCTVLYGDQSALGRKEAGDNTTAALVQQVTQALDPATGFPITTPFVAGAVVGV